MIEFKIISDIPKDFTGSESIVGMKVLICQRCGQQQTNKDAIAALDGEAETPYITSINGYKANNKQEIL